MQDIERFIADCRAARAEGPKAVREIVRAAVDDPARTITALGEPTEAGFDPIYHADDLTIFNIVWAPSMVIRPHNHNMWAVIGIYTGAEDNIFWRRTPDSIEAAGATAMRARDVVPLGKDIIHSVCNPSSKLTGAIHVYGGDFFNAPRSEWDPDALTEKPYSVEDTKRLFAEANARFGTGETG